MKICVINTGGTISSVGTPLAPMSAADFGTAATKWLNPIVAEMFPDTKLDYVVGPQFPESTSKTLDSTNLQPSDWCLMATYILSVYDQYEGFVLLHGTDSMDFTGSALPFLLNAVDENGVGTAVLSKPVIITGSQVPMFYQKASTTDPNPNPLLVNFNTDAFQNFCGAVACARLGIPEVGVYFDSKLYRGNRVLKINASEFLAFGTPNYPPLATYGIELELEPANMLPGPVSYDVSLSNPSVLAQAQAQLQAITAAIDSNPVMQFNAFPAAYNTAQCTSVIAGLIDACVAQGIKGLVLEAYGEGNFPSGNPDHASEGAIYASLKEANDAGVVVLDATQVIAGTVNNSAYASGAWLPSVGALNSSDMTPMVGLAKLTILLAAADFNEWSLDTIKKLLELNLQGENTNVSRLDSRTNAELLPGDSIVTLDGSAELVNDSRVGVQLTAGGDVLWAPITPDAGDLPVRLVMQNDGNLVMYNTSNQVLWATNTGQATGASTQLALMGSGGDQAESPLALELLDYSSGDTITIYPEAHISSRAT